jgi:hypothetical protein
VTDRDERGVVRHLARGVTDARNRQAHGPMVVRSSPVASMGYVPETLDPAAEADLTYRVGVRRAQEWAYQDRAAEFDHRPKKLPREGIGPEQAGRQATRDEEECRQEFRADLTDRVPTEGAEMRRAVGE